MVGASADGSTRVAQLTRAGRTEDALALVLECVDAAEAGRLTVEPAPWWTWQAAVLHRQLGRYGQEAAVLERWLRACAPGHGTPSKERVDISLRLAKAHALVDRAEGRVRAASDARAAPPGAMRA